MRCAGITWVTACALVLVVVLPSEFIAAEKAPRLDVRFAQGRVSVDAVDAKITDILNEIARKAKLKLTLDRRLQGKISTRFENLTVAEALKSLTASRALVYEYDRQADVYRVIQAAVVNRSARKTPQPSANETLPGRHPPKAPPEIKSPVSPSPSGGSTKSYRVPPQNVDSQGRKLYRPGELLVRFQPDVPADAVAGLHRMLGSRVLRRYHRLGIERIRLRDGFSEADALKAFAASELVAHVELNAFRYLMAVPNDPLYAELWGLQRISASKAWDVASSADAVIVAVIDTGIEYFHPDLAANMWQNIDEVPDNGIDDDNNGFTDDRFGYDFADRDPNPLDGSVSGHGTHVAGIIAAVGNNALGVAGVVWTTRIMALKVQADSSSEMDTGSILAALDYAAANGAKVINCSYGGQLYSELEFAGLQALAEQNIMAICAAGNNGLDVDRAANAVYPAGYNLGNIISVAASNTDDELADFSNWGLTSVDLAAPGTGIKSTVRGGSTEAYVQAADTRYPALGMRFAGLTGPEGLSALLIDCGQGYPDEIPGVVAGNIALIKRGSRDDNLFYFSDKVSNAQAKRAAAVIIYNNVVNNFDNSGGTLQTPKGWVPTVSVTLADGIELKNRTGAAISLVNRSLGDLATYAPRNGTSMAAPFVAGAVALGRALKPDAGYAVLKSKILESVDPLPMLAEKMVSGGRLNLFAAVRNLVRTPGDLNCDNTIDIADAVVAIQVQTGDFVNLCREAIFIHDVGGNQKIGYEELIYVLQRIAGRRLEPAP